MDELGEPNPPSPSNLLERQLYSGEPRPQSPGVLEQPWATTEPGNVEDQLLSPDHGFKFSDSDYLLSANTLAPNNVVAAHNKTEQDLVSDLGLPMANASEKATGTPTTGGGLVKTKTAISSQKYRENKRKRDQDIQDEVERLRKEKEEVMRYFCVQAWKDMKVENEKLRVEKEGMKDKIEELRKNHSVEIEGMKIEMERLRKDVAQC